jgi:hypothetical protein
MMFPAALICAGILLRCTEATILISCVFICPCPDHSTQSGARKAPGRQCPLLWSWVAPGRRLLSCQVSIPLLWEHTASRSMLVKLLIRKVDWWGNISLDSTQNVLLFCSYWLPMKITMESGVCKQTSLTSAPTAASLRDLCCPHTRQSFWPPWVSIFIARQLHEAGKLEHGNGTLMQFALSGHAGVRDNISWPNFRVRAVHTHYEISEKRTECCTQIRTAHRRGAQVHIILKMNSVIKRCNLNKL